MKWRIRNVKGFLVNVILWVSIENQYDFLENEILLEEAERLTKLFVFG